MTEQPKRQGWIGQTIAAEGQEGRFMVWNAMEWEAAEAGALGWAIVLCGVWALTGTMNEFKVWVPIGFLPVVICSTLRALKRKELWLRYWRVTREESPTLFLYGLCINFAMLTVLLGLLVCALLDVG